MLFDVSDDEKEKRRSEIMTRKVKITNLIDFEKMHEAEAKEQQCVGKLTKAWEQASQRRRKKKLAPAGRIREHK